MSSFNFKLIDTTEYLSKKDNKIKALITAYCSYGFLVKIYTSKENKDKILELSKQNNFNLTNYVGIVYDNATEKFRYFIKFNQDEK